MGTRGTIPQPIHTLCAEAFDPFGDSLRRHVELTRGGGLAQPFFNNPPHHGLSTFGRQRSILVSVHSVPRESLFVWRHQRSRPGPNGQPPESSHLERRTIFVAAGKNGDSRTIPLMVDANAALNGVLPSSGRIFPISPNAVRLSWEHITA